AVEPRNVEVDQHQIRLVREREPNSRQAVRSVHHLQPLCRQELSNEEAVSRIVLDMKNSRHQGIVTLYIRSVNTSCRLPRRLVGPLALVAGASVLWGCSKLTSPPGPEPIASDTPVTMASAPTVPSGHPPPSNARPSLTALASSQPPPPGPQGELKIDDVVQGKGEP